MEMGARRPRNQVLLPEAILWRSFYQIPSIRSYGQRAIMALPGMRPLRVLKNNSHGFIQILEVLGMNQEK